MNRMDDAKFLKAIESLGFSENEAKCYLAFFKKDPLTASETSKISGVPRQNVYKALEKLLIKGQIIMLPGAVKRYTLSDPNLLIDTNYKELKHSINNELRELEKKKAVITETGNIIEELSFLYRNKKVGDPLDYIEIYKHTMQMHYKSIELFSTAQVEMVGFSTFAPELSDKYFFEQLKPQIDALKRGVKIRTLYEHDDNEEMSPRNFEMLEKTAGLGEESRFINKIPFQMILFDVNTAFITMRDPTLGNPTYTTIIANNTELAGGLKMCFEALWQNGRNYLIVENQKRYLPGSEKQNN